MRLSRRSWFAAIAALSVLAVVDLMAFGVGRYLQSRWKMYRVPTPPEWTQLGGYTDYQDTRHPVLGWPLEVDYGARPMDTRGTGENSPYAHFNPRDCVSIYGDSFALGVEVREQDSWGARLQRRFGCPVGVYGVNGYGTDQAYIRYKLRDDDPSRIVVLTHLSEDISRNLTRNLDLYTGTASYALKPRFVLDPEKNLVQVPIPQLSESEYWRYVNRDGPQLMLEHESFQAGGPAGEVDLEFPYSLSLLRGLFSFRMRAVFEREPVYAQFYERDHPLDGMRITAAILKAFSDEALARNQLPLIVLLPTKRDLHHFEESGEWTYANLRDALEEANLSFLDFGTHLLGMTDRVDPSELFRPLGHYNERANEMLADFVHVRIAGDAR